MPRHRVLISAEARAQLRAIAAWWRKERAETPTLLRQELSEVSQRLALLPGAGAPYPAAGEDVRRILLPRTQHYVYYIVDDQARTVTVVTVWSTARGKGPTL